MIVSKKTCETCTKNQTNLVKCAALAPRVQGDCWAWSDDPDWFKKVQQATQTYEGRASGKTG